MDHPGTTTESKEKEIVIIKWRDVIACAGWEKEQDVECPVVYTVGWLISQTDQTVKIASTLDYDDFAGDSKVESRPIPYGITAFPAGVVLDITYIHLESTPPTA
jgi:hypothetical protein